MDPMGRGFIHLFNLWVPDGKAAIEGPEAVGIVGGWVVYYGLHGGILKGSRPYATYHHLTVEFP